MKSPKQIDNRFISTHTPHTGCDLIRTAFAVLSKFQLTHPTRGATRFDLASCQYILHFNSHTPHGVRRCDCSESSVIFYFNSHTPHGVRLTNGRSKGWKHLFQLTHPTRGATHPGPCIRSLHPISTHTPHTGCDKLFLQGISPEHHFNSHTPHGVRHP